MKKFVARLYGKNIMNPPSLPQDRIGEPPEDAELRGYIGGSKHYEKLDRVDTDPFREARKGNMAHPWIYKTDDYILKNSMFSKQFSRDSMDISYTTPLTHAGRVMKDLYMQFREPYSWHRRCVWFELLNPRILPNAHVAPSATLIGNVLVWTFATVSSNAVLRADQNEILIKSMAVVEENVSITTSAHPVPGGRKGNVVIGEYSVIGANSTLFSCTLAPRVNVGENCVVMAGCVIGEDSTLLPNSVLPPNTLIPAHEVWGGNPAKFIRPMTYREMEHTYSRGNANYELSRLHDYQLMGQEQNPVSIVRQSEEIWENVDKANPPLPEEVDDRPIWWDTWEKLHHEGVHSQYRFTWNYRYWYDKVRNRLQGRGVPTLVQNQLQNKSPFYDNSHLTKTEQERRKIKRPDLESQH